MSDNEKMVLGYIIKYNQTNGFSPSQQDIADGCYMSTTSVRRYLEKLEDKGFIRCGNKRPRSIQVIRFL